MSHQSQSPILLNAVSRIYHNGEFEVHAVDQVDLEIQSGEFTVLSGPSGSGKTTLLNLIGGLDRPDLGEVFVDGLSTNQLSEKELTLLRLHKIGFIFQAYNLLPVLTVYENVQLILQIQGQDKTEHEARILPILERLGLTELRDRFPWQLSGGQQQRVAVARSIVGHPKLVLADEPTANLDSDTARSLMDLMHQLNQEDQVTFLFSSHDPMVVEKASRVIRIRDGKIV